MAVDVWPTVHAERAALAADLQGTRDEQWETPSLCADWTVRQALAHLSSTAAMTPPKFLLGFAKAGFNFSKFSAAGIDSQLGSSPADTLANFVAHQDSSTSPPGPQTSWLGEVIVHAEDIRRPLGIAHEYPVEAVRQVADFYTGSNLLIGTKDRVAGLALRATDTNWSHGAGEEVAGPVLPLLLAMTGRSQGCDELTGPGVATLRQRCG